MTGGIRENGAERGGADRGTDRGQKSQKQPDARIWGVQIVAAGYQIRTNRGQLTTWSPHGVRSMLFEYRYKMTNIERFTPSKLSMVFE